VSAVARAARRSSHAPRALTLRELLGSLEGGSRWAWQLEPDLAAIYEQVIRERYAAAASALRGLDRSPAGGLTAAGHAAWSIPDPDELGLQLRAQFDDRWKTGETDAVRVEAMRRVTKAGLELMRVNFDTRNPLVEGVLGQLGGNIGIAATTRKDIMRSLDSSWKTGLSIPNAAKALVEAGASISQSRAETIARTEMLSAVNGGAHALASLSSDLGAADGQPGLLKIWLTAEDGLVRDDHIDAGEAYGEGNGIPLDEPFLVGDSSMMYPGDQDGAADEVINCRCALSYEEAGASSEPSVSDTTLTEEPPPSEPEPVAEPSFSLPSTIAAPSEPVPATIDAVTRESERAYESELLHPGGVGGALDEYQSTAYGPINRSLRGDPDEPPLGSEDRQVLNQMRDALEIPGQHGTLPDDAILYRGMSVETGADLTGDLVRDPAFLSTTVNPSDALRYTTGTTPRPGREKVALRLHAPAGTRFLAPMDTEGEAILAPGSGYRILGESAHPLAEGVRTLDAVLVEPGAPLGPLGGREALERHAEARAMQRIEDETRAALDRAQESAALQPSVGAKSEFSSDASRWTAAQVQGMFQSDAVERLGLRVLAHAGERSNGRIVKVKARIVDEKGREVASIDRSINLVDKSVYHDSFFIEPDWQGKGIAKDVLRSSISEYEKAGIERVEVTAAGQNGRYTWARFGFDFVNGPGDARSSFMNALYKRALADGKIEDGATQAEITAKLGELYPATVGRIESAQHSWEFANMSLDDRGEHVADFGKQAMIKGRGWDGQLDLAPGSEGRRIFDEYVSR
jgi:GNAT superfamily N-acetyltransferase